MEIFIYYAIFVGLGTGVFIILCFFLDFIWLNTNLLNRTIFSFTEPKDTLQFSVLIALILILTPYIVNHLFSIKYPEKSIDNITQIYNNNEELRELTYQVNLLKEALESPKELTLKQIEGILSNSLNYSEKMKVLLNQNDSIVSLLKDEIETERQNAETAKKIADNLRSLTKGQIESVKFIITEDAKESSKNSFRNGVLLSIPIGLLMSLLSSFLFKKLGEKKKNSISRTMREKQQT